MESDNSQSGMPKVQEAADRLHDSTPPVHVRNVLSPAGGDVVVGVKPVVISPYLTAAEAADYIRSTVQGVYALVKRGRVKPMPGSGKLLFTRGALDKYLAGKRR